MVLLLPIPPITSEVIGGLVNTICLLTYEHIHQIPANNFGRSKAESKVKADFNIIFIKAEYICFKNALNI